MKLNDRNALKELPAQELKNHLQELEEKLFKLKMAHSLTPLKNGLEIRNLKRHRARLMTWIRQREINKK